MKHLLNVVLGLVLLLPVFILSTNVSLAESEDSPSTSVLGLYSLWQVEGYPEGVVEVYFEQDLQLLVVTLETGQTDLEQALLARIIDPENIKFIYVDVSISQIDTESDQSKRTKGVLALLYAYGAGILAVFILLFLKHRSAKGKTVPEKGILKQEDPMMHLDVWSMFSKHTQYKISEDDDVTDSTD